MLLCIWLLSSALGVPTAIEAEEFRPHPTPLIPGEVFRSPGTQGSTMDCFEMYVPGASSLAVEIIVPGADGWEAYLTQQGLTQQNLEGKERGLNRLLRVGATDLVLATSTEGSHLFCVRAQDPLQTLGEYRVVTAFATVPELPCDEEALRRSEDPCELEPDPEPSIAPELPCDEDLFQKGEDPCELEPDPEPFVALCTGDTAADHSEDHGDTFLCATKLGVGESRQGTLENPWGDDRDTFTFTLDSLQSVEIFSTGETDLLATLYDHHGQRLAQADDGGTGENFRMAKTLAPGRYFLRLEAQGATEGAYRLTLRPLHHP